MRDLTEPRSRRIVREWLERDATQRGAAVRYLPIGGTWSWDGPADRGEWWQAGSAFVDFLAHEGFALINPARPFIWSCDLVWAPSWLPIVRRRRLTDWQAAGCNLDAYLRPPAAPDCYVPIADRNVIAHSHALHVVLFACATKDLRIRVLVSVGSPVRRDMLEVARTARKNIGLWLHLCSDGSDRMQWLGELGDGAIGIVRRHPVADINHQIPGVGHSRLLTDPTCFPYWQTQGWLSILRHARPAPAA